MPAIKKPVTKPKPPIAKPKGQAQKVAKKPAVKTPAGSALKVPAKKKNTFAKKSKAMENRDNMRSMGRSVGGDPTKLKDKIRANYEQKYLAKLAKENKLGVGFK